MGKRRMRRALRVALLSIGVALTAASALLFAVSHVPWLGPAFADGLRAVVGAEAVTQLEEWVYGAQDRWNRSWRSGEKPRAYWEVPSSTPEPPLASGSSAPDAAAPFRPRDLGPTDARVAAAGDGVWLAVRHEGHDTEPPLLYKTLVHPDPVRPWAVVFVAAIDLARTELGLMAGSEDPEAVGVEARTAPRPARVPEEEQTRLVAAFNGGFKTEHGHYGMRASGITLIPPRPDVCTILRYDDGTIGIATWQRVAAAEPRMQWWRQTPPCMVEDGQLHPGLVADATTRWGAALGGETAIRRSAVGLDAEGKLLLVGVSEYTTARAMGRALQHAGGHAVAQLDVNWSYPKFLTYRRRGVSLVAESLFPGFVFEEGEYVSGRAPKDFFYVLRR